MVNKSIPFQDRVWRVFTSLKLVIVLLLVLSVLSIIGTVIEQNKPIQQYYHLFKPATVDLFVKLGLLDMYHSWWFTTCLALLALNIAACTMERYPLIMKGMKKQGFILDEKVEAVLTNVATLKYRLDAETVEKQVASVVGRHFAARPVISDAENARHLFYESGRYTRLAFFLTHLSILVIFTGAIIGSLFGFKGYVNINEGESISAVEARQGDHRRLDFSLKCNSFQVEFYPSGAPKDYRSDLSVIEAGKEVARKTIRVNDPLDYGGISFYQSSYGKLPEAVTLEIMGKDGLSVGTVSAPFGKQTDIPGGAQIELLDYRDHFDLPDGSEGGPVYGINIYTPNEPPKGIWISERRPEMNRYGMHSFMIKGSKIKNYTGLQVNKDPGVWLVWAGCVMMVAGIMMAFFMSHRRLWIRIRNDKKGRVEVTVGGTTNKNKHLFASEVERMVSSFREVPS